jgi:putative ATP-dependent endonuclease of OLD family
MRLHAVRIENFRAIRETSLTLDQTTVLIGENDCGKSSILEALSIALVPGPEDGTTSFQAHHFYRAAGEPSAPPVGPILIELAFREQDPGEWEKPELKGIAGFLTNNKSSPRELMFRIQAEPQEGSTSVEADWEVRGLGPGGRSSKNDPTVLAALRQLSPLVWIRSGMLVGSDFVGPSQVEHQPAGSQDVPPDVANLISDIETHYHNLISGTSRQPSRELEAGFNAARDLLARRASRFFTQPSGSRGVIAEIMGEHLPQGESVGRKTRSFHGTAAQQIGVLLLTASLLRSGPGRLAPGAEPIVVIEDPEVHLHPMTIASIWDLLEHIRWQKLVTTQSGTLLSAAPLHSLRRLTRHEGFIREWRLAKDELTPDELRKFHYHVRMRRGVASFARCWLLVEGETEFWVLPELARICGYDFAQEGIACVEFAQCGIDPLIKVAQEFGIEWHVLADGDPSGRSYVDTAHQFIRNEEKTLRVTLLREQDIEHCFWHYGYASVYLRVAQIKISPRRRIPAKRVIDRAITKTSKPFLAFEIIEAVSAPNSPGIPKPLRHLIETCVRLAREAPERMAPGKELWTLTAGHE